MHIPARITTREMAVDNKIRSRVSKQVLLQTYKRKNEGDSVDRIDVDNGKKEKKEDGG